MSRKNNTAQKPVQKTILKLAEEQKDDVKTLSMPIISNEGILGKFMMSANKTPFDEVPTLAASKINTTLLATQWKWYDVMMTNDDTINACYTFRTSKILNTELNILSDEADPISMEAAALVEYVLYELLGQQGGLNFEKLLKYMLTGLYKGFSVCEVEFGDYEGKVVPVKVYDWDQNNFQFDQDNFLRWVTKLGEYSQQGILLPAQNLKYIVHGHNRTNENPYGESIFGGRVFWAYYFKRNGLKSSARLVDRNGMPYIIGQYPNDGTWDKDKKDTFLNDIKNLPYKYAAVYPENGDIKTIEAGVQGKDINSSFLMYMDKMIGVSILGQALTLASEGGGSYARDQIAYDISSDIFKGDCKELESTLNAWIKQWVTYNYGTGFVLPYVKFKTDDDPDIEQRMRIFESAVNMGVPVSTNQVMEEANIRMPDPNEEVLQKQIPQNPFMPPFDFTPENGIGNDPQGSTEDQSEQIPSEASTENNVLNNYAKSNDILKLTERTQKAVVNKLIEQEDKSVKMIADMFTPVQDSILSQFSKQKELDVSKININPKLLIPITDKYFQDSFFLYLYGQWFTKKTKNTIINHSKNNKLLVLADDSAQYLNFMTYDEAVDYFSNRLALSPEYISLLTDQLRSRAFWMSRATSYKVVLDMQNLIQRGITEGLSVQEFVSQNREQLFGMGFDVQSPWYINTVYRTNVSSAYQSGQYKEMTDPAVLDALPYWQYVAIVDLTTSSICKELSNKVYRADNPIWNSIYPPNHFNCRSTVTPIDRQIVNQYGLTVSQNLPKIKGVPVEPQSGFNTNNAKNYTETLPIFSFDVPENWGIR